MLTTDGELASRLMHPSATVEREYAVRLLGEPSEAQLRHLEDGIELDTGLAKVATIEAGRGKGSNAWHHVTLREARHRDLRPMLAAVGLAVSRVIRVRYDGVAARRALPRRKSTVGPGGDQSALRARRGRTARQRERELIAALRSV